MCLIQDKDFYFTRHAEDRMMVIYNKSGMLRTLSDVMA